MTTAHAATLTWDASGVATTTTTATDGAGTWDTTTSRWNNNVSDQAWNNAAGDTAVIGDNNGTAGTLTLVAPITVGGLIFNAPGRGNYTLAGSTLTLSGSRTITTNANASIASRLLGSAGLLKNGAGSLTLTNNANSYIGGTTLSQGTIVTGSNGALSTGIVTLGDAATGENSVSLLGNFANNFTPQILNNIVVSPLGTGTVSIGSTVFNAGSNATNFAGTLTLNRDVTMVGGNADRTSFNGQITGVGNITIAGGRTSWGWGNTSASLNNFVGNIFINAGALFEPFGIGVIPATASVTVNGSLQFGNGSETINGLNGPATGFVQIFPGFNIPATLTVGAANGSGNFAGQLRNGTAAVLSLTKRGTGTQTLSGANTYTGATTLNGGVLSVSSLTNGGVTSNIGQSSNAASSLIFNGGTLQYTGPAQSTNRLFRLNAAGGTIDASGTGAINFINAGAIDLSAQTGPRTLTLAGSNAGANTLAAFLGNGGAPSSLTKAGPGTWLLTGTNTYTGTTTVSAGILRAGVGGQAFGSLSAVTLSNVAGAALDLNNFNQNIGSLAGGGGNGGNITLGSATLTTGGNNTNTSYSGVISGTGGLTKMGAGIQTLSGNNTYSGTTTITAGTLQLGAGGTTGAIVGNVTDNGTLVFNRSDDYSFASTISGSGSVAQTGNGTTTLTGSNTYSGGSTVLAGTLRLTGNGAIGSGAAVVQNGATLAIDEPAGGAYTFANALSGTGALQVNLDAPNRGFNFAPSAGAAFAGSVALHNSTFSLADTNTTALTNATLSVESGNTTTVGVGQQSIGNLSLNGGRLDFPVSVPSDTAPAGAIDTGVLALNSASVGITVPNPAPTPSGALLTQDDGASIKLISAASVVGNAANLTLLDQSGNPVGTTRQVQLQQGANTVAIGSYGVNLNTGTANDGLYVGYGLTQLDLQAGQALTLDGDTAAAGAAELHARLTGSGNLSIEAANSITLNNPTNNYSGTTGVTSGTLRLGSDRALGNTTQLSLDTGAGADINGHAQTIGALDGEAGSSLTMNGGNLTITGGGAFSGVVSGTSGILNLSGGTLTLTGNNTYTGATTIAPGGTLQIGDGGISGAIVGNVIDDGALVFNRGDTATYAGVASGGGTLQMAGAGTTILTGNNTYTGGTTIGAGALQIGNGGTTGSILGNVTNNAALIFNRSDALSFTGQITGTGSLTQAGAGTTTLTASGSSVGNAEVTAGTLALSTADAFTTGNYTTADGATTRIAANSALSVGGAFTQTTGSTLDVALGNTQPIISAVTANLAGTLNITGFGASVPSRASALASSLFNVIHTTGGITNDFASVNVGTVSPVDYLTVAGSKSASGLDYNVSVGLSWLAGPVSGNGVFTLPNAADAFDVDVALSDQPASVVPWNGKTLTKNGAGTLTLSATNTYTGGTTVAAGTLQLGNGGTTGSIVGDIANNGALTFNRSDVLTFPGAISGSGAVSQIGTGTTVLTGVNTYAGPTTVTAGTLRAGATNTFSAASTHIVAPGATLDTGGFDQQVAALNNNGAVSLVGDTAGSTLTVNGDYVAHGLLRLGTGLADGASVSDRLVLDGPGASASGSTTIQIATLTGLGALTTGNGIEVVSGRNGATTTAQSSRDAFILANGHVDAGAFEYRLYAADALGADENWYLRSTAPILTPGELLSTGQSSPPVLVPTYRAEVPLLAALPAQLRQADFAMLGNLHQRIGDEFSDPSALNASDSDTRRAWTRMVYSDLDIRQPGVADAHSQGHVAGLQAGADILVSGDWRAGTYVGYLDGRADVSGNAHGVTSHVGRNDLQSSYLGAYATWMDASGFYVDSVLQGSSHRYTVRPSPNPSHKGKANSLTASVESGKPFALSERWSIEPQAQLIYQHVNPQDMALSGALVRQDDDSGWIGRLGVRITGDISSRAGRLLPYARLNLYRASFDNDVVTFIGPAGTTAIKSAGDYRAAEAAVGATLALTSTTDLYGEIGELWNIGSDAQVKSSVQASLGVKVRW